MLQKKKKTWQEAAVSRPATERRKTAQSGGQQMSNLLGQLCYSQETALSGQHPRVAAFPPPPPPPITPPPKRKKSWEAPQ